MVVTVTIEDIKALIKEGLESNPQSLEKAQHILYQMTNHDPDNWIALFMLAGIFLHRDIAGVAIALWERAAELAPNQSEIWNNIGTAYRREHINDRAEAAFLRAIELNDKDADIYNNLGTLHINEGTPAKGEEYLRRAIELDPGHKHAHWNLGLTLLEQEKWEEGFKEYTWGLTTNDRMHKNYGHAQWWHGQPHPDKKLVIYGEQGVGDEMMFMSCVQDVLDGGYFKEVILDVHPRLENMMRRAYPSTTVYPTRKIWDRPCDWVDKEKPDFKVAAGTLPRFFRKTEEDFPKRPYIAPPQDMVDEYKEWLGLLGPAPYIGLSWIGGHKRTRKDLRAIGLKAWMPLFQAFPDATFISLQYSEHGRHDTAALFEETGIRVHHFPEVTEAKYWERYHVKTPEGEIIETFRDKDEMKAYLHHHQGMGLEWEHVPGPAYDMDEIGALAMAIHQQGGLIITVNNSLVHHCGVMGVDCFTATPSAPAWRYGLTRDDMVWYGPVIRQFRQKPDEDDWERVINEITAAAREHLWTPQQKLAT